MTAHAYRWWLRPPRRGSAAGAGADCGGDVLLAEVDDDAPAVVTVAEQKRRRQRRGCRGYARREPDRPGGADERVDRVERRVGDGAEVQAVDAEGSEEFLAHRQGIEQGLPADRRG